MKAIFLAENDGESFIVLLFPLLLITFKASIRALCPLRQRQNFEYRLRANCDSALSIYDSFVAIKIYNAGLL